MLKLVVCFVFIYIPAHNVNAQAINDSIVDSSTADAIDLYYKSWGEQSPLYNGTGYIDYAFSLQEGTPFFGSTEFVRGEIFFDGMIFHNVPMLYDMVKDKVVIKDFHNLYKIELPANRIQQFTLIGHTFVRIMHDDLNSVNTGFYDQLYDGTIKLLVRREKKIKDKYSNQQIDKVVSSSNSYYIRKNGDYYSFKNKRGLLGILKDRKKEIIEYLNKNEIKFNDNPEKAMMSAVQYYDRLKN